MRRSRQIHSRRRLPHGIGAALILLLLGGTGFGSPRASEMQPLRLETAPSGGAPRGRFGERTISAAVEIDRDGARLLFYAVKERLFVRPVDAGKAQPYRRGHRVPLEVVLQGPEDARYTQHLTVGRVCLDHGPHEPSHVQGDTILVHRDAFLIELPERQGFDRFSVSVHLDEGASVSRQVLATERLDAARFTAAGGTARYRGLAFAEPGESGSGGFTEGTEDIETTGTVRWPQDFGDTENFLTFGDETEATRRINVTIVPDGYTYAEKATMEAHAQNMVAHFRNKTPYSEHDPFMNYHLVYAYSLESGTDECDCNVVKDTAMGTRFLQANPTCGHSDNRCLYYGPGCDTNSSGNIVAAEIRAPASDTTIVMVNTARYGGCGGARAVYSAANAAALEVAVHELGHTLGNLADEYQGEPGCGTIAGEINTSTNSTNGAWPEWIGNIGAPHEGGQYYDMCIYRPELNCEMRSLNQPFCAVCNQQWSLVTFGHFRVNPTSPVEDMAPASPTDVFTFEQTDFSVTTRLSQSPATSAITWTMDGPGFAGPTVVATGTESYSHTFTQSGTYSLTCEVVADANFVKPVKNGANVDTVLWSVNAIDSSIDGDGDGFAPNQGDCDDLDITVFPGAPQLCDAKNNDCDEVGWPGVSPTEIDDDGDGYAECAGDCDDAENAVHPGAVEIGCDGIENDCNPATPDLLDGDSDTFTCDTDCDDGETAVHPGAPEVNDGVDNQCPGDPGHGFVDELAGDAGFSDPVDLTKICWPAQPGAAMYEVIRSGLPDLSAGCQREVLASTCWSDPQDPPPGGVQHYVVRSLRPHAGSAWTGAAGGERAALCGEEAACGDGLDNDADTLLDCEDPGCLASPACPSVAFSFADTFNDDIADGELEAFFSSAPVLPDDYLHASIVSQATVVYEWCSGRPDWYRDTYLTLAPTGGSDFSGTWDRWYGYQSVGWTGPFASPLENHYGFACGGPYSWCAELGLGPGAIGIIPADVSSCESVELASGCSDGSWTLTLRLAADRMSACGF